MNCKRSLGLTWGKIHRQITFINILQDVIKVSFLPDEAAHVFLFVQTVKEKAGVDQAIVGCSLHEGDVAPLLFAAGNHAVLLSLEFRRRNERRSVLYRFIGVENKILPTRLESFQALLTGLLAAIAVREQHNEEERRQEWIHFSNIYIKSTDPLCLQ